ncbi:WbqC family protein [Saccharothrix texasensis]
MPSPKNLVTIHQPHFLPWLGYINKLAVSDTFIFLDDVDFRRDYFQHRTRIVTRDGALRWATLPVVKHSSGEVIRNIYIHTRGIERVIRIFENEYRHHPNYRQLHAGIWDAMRSSGDRLLDVNMTLIRHLCNLLGLRCRIYLASDLCPRTERTTRIYELARITGGDALLVGSGNMLGIHDTRYWQKRGIAIYRQNFIVAHHKYVQPSSSSFVAMASTVDALFSVGAKTTGMRVMHAKPQLYDLQN